MDEKKETYNPNKFSTEYIDLTAIDAEHLSKELKRILDEYENQKNTADDGKTTSDEPETQNRQMKSSETAPNINERLDGLNSTALCISLGLILVFIGTCKKISEWIDE